MKLPLSFDNRIFLRLLIPGTFVSLGLLPGVMGLLRLFDIDADIVVVLPFLILTVGWFLTLLDMPIYMFLEGRRYWPRRARENGLAIQKKRLKDWLDKASELENAGDELGALEFKLRAQRYPLGNAKYPPESGEVSAMVPTELGNVIYGFETYPKVKYGVDGVFFWERIWFGLDPEMRKNLDEHQAQCDSAVYACFGSILNTVLFTFYGLLENIWGIELMSSTFRIEGYLAATGFLVLSRLFYVAAIHVNYQFGERIKAMFDVSLDKLGIDAALAVIEHRTGVHYRTDRFYPHNVMAAWRFLRWHKFKPTPDAKSVNIEEYVSQRNDDPGAP